MSPGQGGETTNPLHRDTASLLKRVGKRVTELTASLKQYKKAAGSASGIINSLEAIRQAIRSIGELEQSMMSMSEAWRTEVEKEFLQLEADLRQVCNGRGWRVDG